MLSQPLEKAYVLALGGILTLLCFQFAWYDKRHGYSQHWSGQI